MNFRDGDAWKAIDNRLERLADGRVSNRANRYDVTFPSKLGSGAVKVSEAGRSVAFTLKGAAGSPRVSAASATYAGALPNVDVRYDALADAVKETLLLRTRSAQREFRFDLRLSDGLRARLTDGGAVEVVDGDGIVRFVVPAPVVWDAATPDRPTGAPVRFRLDGGELVLSVDDAYVDDPARTFPVSVDPWVQIPSWGLDCELSAKTTERDQTFCGQQTMRVGNIAGSERRAIVNFPVADTLPEHVTVLEGYAKLYLQSAAGNAWSRIEVNALTRPFTDWQATWNRASTAQAWTTPGGDYSATKAAEGWFGAGDPAGWSYWTMPDQIQRWADGTDPDHGIIVRSTVPASDTALTFKTTDHPDPDLHPQVTVVYEPIMGTDGPFSFVSENVGDISAQVNVASGRLTVHDTAAQVSTAGPGFALDAFYNSASDRTFQPLNRAWKLGAQASVQLAGNGDALVETPSGTWLRFPVQPDATFTPPAGSTQTLTQTTTGYELLDTETSERLVFDDGGRLIRRQRDGTAGAVTYTYNNDDQLITVTDAEQHQTQFTYDNAERLQSVTLPDNRVVTYSVDDDGVHSRTIAGQTTAYTYNTAGLLARITTPGGTVKFTYDSSGRVLTMTRVTNVANDSGPTTTISYFGVDALGPCPTGSRGRAEVNDPDGVVTTYCFDEAAQVVYMTSTGQESPVVEQIAAEGYAERHGLSLEAARAALRLQDRASELDENVEAVVGLSYGGTWFDNNTRRVQVGVKTGAQAAPAQTVVNQAGLSADVDVIPVPHSQRELEQANLQINSQLSDLVAAGRVRSGWATDGNLVRITEANNLSIQELQRVTSARASVQVATEVSVADAPTLQMVSTRCDGNRCDPPLRGGLALYDDGLTVNPSCTAGFVSRRGNDHYVLTAGHCVTGGANASRIADWSGVRLLLGFDADVAQPGDGDLGLVGVNPTSPFKTSLRPWIYLREGGVRNSGRALRRDPSYAIKRAKFNQVGWTICGTGATTGTHCGEILQLGEPVTAASPGGLPKTFGAQGILDLYGCKKGVAKNDPKSAIYKTAFQPGDSGGPYVRSHYAVGIQSSSDPRKCLSTFSGAAQAELSGVLGIEILGQ